MENAEKFAMVPAGFGWSDVGSWDAVAGAHEADETVIALSVAINCISWVQPIHILKA